MAIQLWRARNGFTYNGVNYEFPDVDGAEVVRNGRKHLTRGANSTNKRGFVYLENAKQASTVTFNSVNLPADIVNILNNAYDNEERIDVFCVDNATGENLSGKDAIITHYVQQLNITEGEDTYNIALEFETFNLKVEAK